MTVTKPGIKKRGGRRSNSGRKKGVRNKKTIERELEKARKKAHDKMVEEARIVGAAVDVATAVQANVKLGKEILSDFANVLASAAAYYQPRPGNQYADEPRFLKYSELAIYAADKLTPYQSPRLAAMMIGQAQTKRLAISGGLPARDAAPMLTEEQHKQAMIGVGPDVQPIDGAQPAPAPPVKIEAAE